MLLYKKVMTRILSVFKAASLLFLLTVCSCSSGVVYEDLVGVYKVQYPYGTEELVLNRDGTYKQTILLTNKDEVSHTGQWKFLEKESKVVLKDPLIVDDNFGRPNPNFMKVQEGLWILRIEKRFRAVSLHWNDDQGFVFEKS